VGILGCVFCYPVS